MGLVLFGLGYTNCSTEVVGGRHPDYQFMEFKSGVIFRKTDKNRCKNGVGNRCFSVVKNCCANLIKVCIVEWGCQNSRWFCGAVLGFLFR